MKNTRTSVIIIVFAVIFLLFVFTWFFLVHKDKTLVNHSAVSDVRNASESQGVEGGVRPYSLCEEYPRQNGVPGNIKAISNTRLSLSVNWDRIFDNPCSSMPDQIDFGLTPNTVFVERILRDKETYLKELEVYKEQLKKYQKENQDNEYAYVKVQAPSPYEDKPILVNRLAMGGPVLIYVDDKDISVAKQVVMEYLSN